MSAEIPVCHREPNSAPSCKSIHWLLRKTTFINVLQTSLMCYATASCYRGLTYWVKRELFVYRQQVAQLNEFETCFCASGSSVFLCSRKVPQEIMNSFSFCEFFTYLGHRSVNLFKALQISKSVNLLSGEVNILPLFKQN